MSKLLKHTLPENAVKSMPHIKCIYCNMLWGELKKHLPKDKLEYYDNGEFGFSKSIEECAGFIATYTMMPCITEDELIIKKIIE